MFSRSSRARAAALLVSLFVLSFTAAAQAGPPANDDFANAQLITGTAAQLFPATNVDATRESGEPTAADFVGFDAGRTVWFKWVAPDSAPVQFDTCGAPINLDSLLTVWTGSSLATLTELTSNDEGTCGSGSSLVEFTPVSGTTYYLQVDEWSPTQNGAGDTFGLRINGPAANDDLSAAASLFDGAQITTSNLGATAQAGEPAHAGSTATHSLWYRLFNSTAGPITITTCGSAIDTVLAVYSSSNFSPAMGDLTATTSSDDSAACGAGSTQSAVTFTGQAFTSYFIAVDGKAGATGALKVNMPPRNDAFANATPATSSSYSANTALATKEAGEPNHAGNSGGHSIWWTFTPTVTGSVTIDVCADFDSLLAVYTGSAVGALTPVASNDDSNSHCFGEDGSRVTFSATANVPYRVAVDGKDGASGALSISFPPANDHLAAPEPLFVGSSFANTQNATKEAGEPNHAGNTGGRSVWFSFTAMVSGPAKIRVCGGDFDTLLAVYTGSTFGALSLVAQNDDTAGCGGGTGSVVTFDAVGGTDYRIALDGKNGAGGFTELELVSGNDDFAASQDVGSTPSSFFSSLTGASKETGEPNHAGNAGGHSVWYSWTAPTTRAVTVDTCNFFGVDTLLAVYTGSAVNALTPVQSSDDAAGCIDLGGSPAQSSVTFSATAGTTYRIAIDGKDGSTGIVSLNFHLAPANDDLAAATEIVGFFPVSGTLAGAGKQAGEPNHGDQPGGNSVWFSHTASFSGPLSVDTCGSNVTDTLLGVYEGATIETLSSVGQNDDSSACAPGSQRSRVTFNANSGTTYRIAVDSNAGAVGPISVTLSQPATSNDFADAAVISSGSLGGNNLGTTKESGEPSHGSDAGGQSVWYSWTASQTGPVSVDLCLATFDTLLGVYTGSAVNGLSLVGDSDDNPGCGTGSKQSKVTFAAVDGTTYYFAVDGKGGVAGSFQIQVNLPPANDHFADAQDLVGDQTETFVSTANATKETGEPNHAGNSGGASVWFSWTPTETGAATLTTCGSSVDTLLAVYTGSAVDALTPVPSGSNDDGACGGGPAGPSRVSFTATAGTTYRIAVDGKNGQTGSVKLTLNPPANDDLANARALTGASTSTSGSTVGAGSQSGEPDHGALGSPFASVWFTWTAPTTGAVTMSTCGSSFDTTLAVYTGGATFPLTPVASNNDSCGGQSAVTFSATAGTAYKIAVDGSFFSRGAYVLNVGVPANDAFAGAQTISGFSGVTSTNAAASTEPSEPLHAGQAGGASLWYQWTAAATGPVVVDLCDSAIDTLLGIYQGSSVSGLTPVASNDNSAQCPSSTRSRVQFNAQSGQTYRFAVDGKANARGAISIDVEVGVSPPANDDFEDATPVLADRAVVTGTTVGATKQTGEPDHAGNTGGGSAWWSWTAPSTGSVSAGTCGSDFDTLLAVYEGASVDGLTEVGSGNDDVAVCGTDTKTSGLIFNVEAGHTYYFAVDGKNGEQGSVSLHVNPPANDLFFFAEQIPAAGGTVTASSVGAAREPGEPSHGGLGGASLWYHWTPIAPGTVSISTCGSSVNTLLGVYTGSSVTTLSSITANDDNPSVCGAGTQQSAVSFTAVAGTTYRIAVDSAIAGDLLLSVNTPINDRFAGARAVSGSNSSTPGTVVGATAEPGEPAHAGSAALTSVWYRWRAPADGATTIDTCDATFGSRLAVYTGATLSALSEVAADAGFCGGQGQVTFTATRGTVYWIAVDGNGPQGTFTLAIEGQADVTDPDTTIDSGPTAGSTIASTSTTLGFSSDEEDVTFSCWVDSLTPAACTSPRLLTGLSQGAHTFHVAATDPAGNADETPATRTFTVDTVAPQTTITVAPTSPRNQQTATLEFTSSEGASTFECKVDTGSFALCSSPYTTPTLAAGSHTVQVRAIDAVGNVDATPDSTTFVIDLTAPETTIDTGPSGLTNAATPQFTYSSESGATFECKLDTEPDFTSCTSPISYAGLSDGTYTLSVRATDAAGNVDATPATRTFTRDTAEPQTTIVQKPAALIGSTSASFTYSSSEGSSTFECRISSAASFASCPVSGTSYSGLAEGSHTFEVRATDPAGNVDPTPDTWTFTVDVTAPPTAIDTAPATATKLTSATFTFSSADGSVTAFQCQLDGGGFTGCTSPQNYTGLSEGQHTFMVRAVDPAGNADTTPDSHTWTIDTTPPDTGITGGPTGPTNNDDPSFTLTTTQSPSTYECKLTGDADFTACTSPKSFSNLAEGAYTFEVRATDAAGNTDASPASRTFTVDTTPPDTSFTTGPPNGATVTTTDPEYGFSATGATAFECKVDSGSYASCTSPNTFTGLGQGLHTISVRAVDAAGNPDPSPAERTVTVDTVAPETTLGTSPPDATSSTTAAFTFSSASTDADGFQCQLDGGGFSSCTSPQNYTGLSEAQHTFMVRTIDAAGNVDATPASRTWTIDTTAPDSGITGGPTGLTSDNDPSFTLTSTQTPSTFECKLTGESSFTTCTTPKAYANLADGSYTLEVRATDAAGNADTTPATRDFTVDATPPDTQLTGGPSGVTSDNDPSFAFTSSGGGSGFECKLTGASSFTSCTSPRAFTDLADGAYTFEVRAIDAAGNADPSPATVTWTVDATRPDTSITSGPTGTVDTAEASFAFAAADATATTFECKLDGGAFASCSSPRALTGLTEGAHTFSVRAADAAGNVEDTPATRSWTVAFPVTTPPAATTGTTPPPPPPVDQGAVIQRLADQAKGLVGENVTRQDFGLGAGGVLGFQPRSGADGTIDVPAGGSEELLVLFCATDCTATVDETLTLSGAGKASVAATRKIKLKRQVLRAKAGMPIVVKVRLTAAQRKLIKKAKSTKLKLTIAVLDASGKTTKASKTFRLKLKTAKK